MYYFNNSIIRNEAVMSRILAEDTGAAELRTTMSDTKASFKFHRPNWLRRKEVSPALCDCCSDMRPASC